MDDVFFTPEYIPEPKQKPPQELKIPGTEYRDDYRTIHPEDSKLWLELYILADIAKGEELCAMLAFVRNTGAILIKNDLYGYIIQPVIGPNGWESREHYEKERVCMSRFKEDIIDILKKLRGMFP